MVWTLSSAKWLYIMVYYEPIHIYYYKLFRIDSYIC